MIDLEFWKQHYSSFIKFIYVTFVKAFPIYIECLLEFLMLKNRKRKCIKQKIILVTGGGGIIGREIARNLAKHDNECYVVIADICYDSARYTVEFIKNAHQVNSFAYTVDVSDFKSVTELRNNILRDLGYVDIIINSAEMVDFDSIVEKDWTDCETILKTNLHSHFWLTKVFLPDMIQRKSGHIVGVSSIIGYFHSPYAIAYTASKYGINGFMRCLQDELIAEGHSDYIKTTLACPYFMREDITEARIKFSPLTPEQSGKMIVDGILRNKSEIIVAKFPFVVKLAMILPKKVVNLIMMEYLPEVQKKKPIIVEEPEEQESDEEMPTSEEETQPNDNKTEKTDGETKSEINIKATEGEKAKTDAEVPKPVEEIKATVEQIEKKNTAVKSDIVAGWMTLTMTSKLEKQTHPKVE